jgi:hypothetical protein
MGHSLGIASTLAISDPVINLPEDAMKKIHVVTLKKLNSALYRVSLELDRLGIWTSDLCDVDVYLTPLHPGGLVAYGWKYDGKHGCIMIPAVSWPRLSHYLGFGSYLSLAHVLRHEFAHAVADVHHRLTRCERFRKAFGASYDSGIASSYDPEEHISVYASSQPAEDFAEMFAAYVRHRGDLPTKWGTPPIRTKWSYIRKLCVAIDRGRRTW